MAARNTILWRMVFIYIAVFVSGIFILLRVMDIMMLEGRKWREKAAAYQPMKPIPIPANRADILAEDGRILATSVPYYEIRFDPLAVRKDIFDAKVDSLALCLSRFFKDGTREFYSNKLKRARSRKNPNRYLLVNRRRIDHKGLKIVRTFPIFRLGKNRGGFQPIVYNRRIQPHLNLAGRTIGGMSTMSNGLREGNTGLEAQFEEYLRGENGYSLKRMMSGVWMTLPVEEPVDGMDVLTTIDVDYQDIVQEALKKQLEKSMATMGCAVLMEVRTGDIKAMANLALNSEGRYVENRNFAVAGAGEPGSVIKAASMISLLEDGYVGAHDTLDLGEKGEYKIYNHVLKESHGGLKRVTVGQMMEKSSNGIAKLVFDHYKDHPEKFVNRWYAMGLDRKTGICLPGEADPWIKYPKDKHWSGTTLPWMSIGYDLMLTPLQILCFYNAIANDGQRMKPRLVQAIRCQDDVVESFDVEEVGNRICSRKTLREIREMLEGVVIRGTARNIHTDRYPIAGKTGTARIADATGEYSGGRYRASFVGYFPADEPLYSCIVMIVNPKNGYYATTVSAPVFREIADKVYSMAYVHYGKQEGPVAGHSLPVSKNGLKADFETIFDELDMELDGLDDARNTEWVLTASNEGENMKVKPKRVNFSSVPDVRGMGLRDALYLLENAGLKVTVTGAGMVRRQSLPAGSEVYKGSCIWIELR